MSSPGPDTLILAAAAPHTVSRDGPPHVFGVDGLDALLEALRADGYTTIGPQVRNGAVVYDDIASTADLPAGWEDTQDAATYRLARTGSAALFGCALGAQSWKRFFYPPKTPVFALSRAGGEFVPAESVAPPVPRYALIGARACELAAISRQDRVLRDGFTPDPTYTARRAAAFIVAVQCTRAVSTCFCVSQGTGPRTDAGFDLALTELVDGGKHVFVCEVGTPRGAAVLARIGARPASHGDLTDAARAHRGAETQPRHLPDRQLLHDTLLDRAEHPHWDDIAHRCLSCGACTLSCPTCFCSTTADATDISGDIVTRTRLWDSCFTLDFSYIHGGSVRASGRSRYRQWMTHKLATWIDQFGASGCVGCGRCITWCPVGIDMTAEAAALARSREETVHAND